MSNPYHDENGRFSSKAGMSDAVDRVARSGNVGAYLDLRSEFEPNSVKNTTPSSLNLEELMAHGGEDRTVDVSGLRALMGDENVSAADSVRPVQDLRLEELMKTSAPVVATNDLRLSELMSGKAPARLSQVERVHRN